MKWTERAEQNLSHLAIPHLIRAIGLLNALVFILYKLNPGFVQYLTLDPAAVWRGEVWRLVSFIFIPSLGGPVVDWLFAALYILYLWWIGDGLEESLGSFRVNLYYLIGVVGTVIAALATGSPGFANGFLNSSLFFAFARFYPDNTIYFMFLIPVKIRWMAWITAAFIAFQFVFGSWEGRFAVIAAFANYFIFFGRETFQAAVLRREVDTRRKRFEAAQPGEDESLHRCEACGRTEHVAPELEFRVARDGNEYCVEHLPKPPAAL